MKLLFSFALLASSLFAQKSVRYELSFPNAAHHEAEIRATFTGATGSDLLIHMSRSSPGRYALHEFAKNIYHVRATDEAGHALALTQPDPYSWTVSSHHGTVTFVYTLFGDHADGTYAAIDDTHAHLNLPATLVWAQGFENAPSTLKFEVPAGSNWKAATQLIPQADDTWSAPNLEQLMDSPVELSVHDSPEWKVEDAAFRLSLHHRGTAAQAAVFAQMCQAVVLEEEGVFGSFPKYDNGSYTFLIDYLPYVNFDGMEHRDSTVISGTGDLRTSAAREIGTVSHEFFHSWNVRRTRPRSLEPFDFEHVNMSGELWFAEGFTNYYGILVLKRAGFNSLDQFAGAMGSAVNTVLTAPGRNVHNVIEMSRLAGFVDAAKSIDPTSFPNTFISYYTYGQALALGIDLAIRSHFPGKSLDDWMRTMWREHPDIEKPYTLEDLQAALAETTGSADFAADIFHRHIEGVEPLPYGELLASAGFALRKSHPGKVWLGVRDLKYSDEGFELDSEALRDSPLYTAGLDNGDRILHLNGKSITNAGELNSWLEKRHPGDRVRVEAETRAGAKTVAMTLTEDPSLEVVTYEQASLPVTPQMQQLRQNWLTSKALHTLPKIDPMP